MMDTDIIVVDGADGLTPEMLRKRPESPVEEPETCLWSEVTELQAGLVCDVFVPPNKLLTGTIEFLRQTVETPVIKCLRVGNERHILRDSCEVTFPLTQP